jgi:hypothetical protein
MRPKFLGRLKDLGYGGSFFKEAGGRGAPGKVICLGGFEGAFKALINGRRQIGD